MVVEIIRKDICDEDSKSSTNVLVFILFFKNGGAGTQSKQGLWSGFRLSVKWYRIMLP